MNLKFNLLTVAESTTNRIFTGSASDVLLDGYIATHA